MQLERSPSEKQCDFKFKTFDLWLVDHVNAFHVDDPYSNEWKYFFVTMTDYICNPAILKKNQIVLDILAKTYLPELDVHPEILDDLKKMFNSHQQ